MKISTKYLSFAALAILAFSPAGRAADNDTPPPPADQPAPPPRMKHMRENRMKQLDETLHLTADQKTQVKAIWDKAAEKGRALRKDAALAREDRRAKVGEIMSAAHEQVRTVLTPDQQKLFDALPVGRARDGTPPPPPPAAKSE